MSHARAENIMISEDSREYTSSTRHGRLLRCDHDQREIRCNNSGDAEPGRDAFASGLAGKEESNQGRT